jgi:hypothetical protein
MTSKLKTDVLETVSGSGTIALTNQLSGMTDASMPAGSVVQIGTFLLTGSDLAITTTTETALTSWSQSFTKKFSNSILLCHLQFHGYYSANPSYWWLRGMVNGTNVTSAAGSGDHAGSGTIMTHSCMAYTFSSAAHQQFNCHFWDNQNNTTADFTFSFRQSSAGTWNMWDAAQSKLIITEIKQ